MADLAITISDTIDMVGGDPPNLWNQYNWGAFDWGSGGPVDDVIHHVGKLISNTQTEATANIFDIEHLVVGDGFTLATAVILAPTKFVVTDIIVTHDLFSQTLTDGGTWKYNYGSADDGEDRNFTSWTAGTEPSEGWSEVSKPSDSWS